MSKEKNAVVWLGKGTFSRGGKSYTRGQVIPGSVISDIDPKELKSLKEKKLIGNPIKTVNLSEKDSLIENQSKAIRKLQTEAGEMKAEIKEKDELISGMIDQISEKDELISNLQKDQTSKGKKPSDS